MTKPTGSETSTTDPTANSQDSAGPSEFPPPSRKALLDIVLLPYGKIKKSRWKQIVLIFRKTGT